MSITPFQLPFERDSLEPFLSEEAVDIHYNGHYLSYIEKLNKLVSQTRFEAMPIEQIIQESSGYQEDIAVSQIFKNASQVWNHEFYWKCLERPSSSGPGLALQRRLIESFGSVADFTNQFNTSANSLFGSGWTWLISDGTGKLQIQNFANAETPLVKSFIPLLTCDIWEHAYYVDYHNERARYLDGFWKLVNWHFVDSQCVLSEPTVSYTLQ